MNTNNIISAKSSWAIDVLAAYLEQQGISPQAADWLVTGIALIGLVALSFIANFVAKKLILTNVQRVVSRSKGKWDEALIKWKVFNKVSHLAPALVFYFLAPALLKGHPSWVEFFIRGSEVYMIMVGLLVVDSLLNAFHEVYETKAVSREIPIKGFLQVIKIILYFVVGIWGASILIGKSPFFFLSGLGALTAVLMLVFKDPILGFVAGIQLTTNKMIAVGDWIEMPKHHADGDVMEVALTTVKVRNWDKTITTIPTYALISDSFKNWRGMSESGGRRIKRSCNIDMSTIRFCTEEMLERFARIAYISDYIEKKKAELQEYNAQQKVDLAALANGRRLTNVGTFRAYVVAYLRHHPMINLQMTFLVRQLEPTEHGLPIQVYVFSKDKVWANYEAIQADIFDHILAVAPEFDLRVFQEPSGADFQRLSSR